MLEEHPLHLEELKQAGHGTPVDGRTDESGAKPLA
jgi:hypothetical protein